MFMWAQYITFASCNRFCKNWCDELPSMVISRQTTANSSPHNPSRKHSFNRSYFHHDFKPKDYMLCAILKQMHTGLNTMRQVLVLLSNSFSYFSIKRLPIWKEQPLSHILFTQSSWTVLSFIDTGSLTTLWRSEVFCSQNMTSPKKQTFQCSKQILSHNIGS